MGREILNQFGNGQKIRFSIDNFGKLNRAISIVKIDDEDFYVMENLVKRTQAYNSLVKRYGFHRFNGNAISANNLINIYEAKMIGGYYLLGKDSNPSAGTSRLYYLTSPYTSAWQSISNTEFNSYYRFITYANKVYIVNRVNEFNLLQDNKVWLAGNSFLSEHGCLPLKTNELIAEDSAVVGQLTTGKNYVYILVNVYDEYQISASFDVYNFYNKTGNTIGGTSLKLTIPSISEARIKSRKIYRSKGLTANSGQASSDYGWNPPPEDFYYITTMQGNGSATYIDTKADDELGLPTNVNSFFQQKRPYRSKYITVAKNRLIQANLVESSLKYSAITYGNISLTEDTGGGLTAGEYKFRLYKAYANHSGDRNVYVVGNYTEKSITILGGSASVVIDLTSTADFDEWCRYVYIERTVVNGSEFYPIGIMDKDGTFRTMQDDIELSTQSGMLPLDIIKTEGENEIKFDRISSQSFKDAIAISDINSGDLINPEPIILNTGSNIGITGIFTEQGRIIAFTPSAIYSVNTDSTTTEFWITNKVIDNIGAMGQNTDPNTETAGHNGILQLPENSGYIFFNRAYTNSVQEQIKIYYWNGNDNSQPLLISEEIDSIINGNASFILYGMTYDYTNNWIWVSLKLASTHYVYVYDVKFKQWYIFSFHTLFKAFDVLCIENGKLFLTGDNGYFQYYAFDLAEGIKYFDRFYYSSALNYATFISKIQSKSIDILDADIQAVRFGIILDTTINNTTSNTMVIGRNDSEDSLTVATDSGLFHKLQRNCNLKGNRVYFRWENNEGKGMILQKLYFDLIIKHKLSAGR